MNYVSRPVLVDAHIIIGIGAIGRDGSMSLALQNGENVTAHSGMLARYIPTEGDYWVIQEDGYVYVNPKAVFERKYRPLMSVSIDWQIEELEPKTAPQSDIAFVDHALSLA